MRDVAVLVVQGINAIPYFDSRADHSLDLQRRNAKTLATSGVIFLVCAMQDRVIVCITFINAFSFFNANDCVHGLYLPFSIYDGIAIITWSFIKETTLKKLHKKKSALGERSGLVMWPYSGLTNPVFRGSGHVSSQTKGGDTNAHRKNQVLGILIR